MMVRSGVHWRNEWKTGNTYRSDKQATQKWVVDALNIASDSVNAHDEIRLMDETGEKRTFQDWQVAKMLLIKQLPEMWSTVQYTYAIAKQYELQQYVRSADEKISANKQNHNKSVHWMSSSIVI